MSADSENDWSLGDTTTFVYNRSGKAEMLTCGGTSYNGPRLRGVYFKQNHYSYNKSGSLLTIECNQPDDDAFINDLLSNRSDTLDQGYEEAVVEVVEAADPHVAPEWRLKEIHVVPVDQLARRILEIEMPNIRAIASLIRSLAGSRNKASSDPVPEPVFEAVAPPEPVLVFGSR